MELDSQSYRIDLFVSKLSKKMKVLVNGEIRMSGKKKGTLTFSYSFKIGRYTIGVLQIEKTYDLRIDSFSFEQVYQM
jgi:hypothetical protein